DYFGRPGALILEGNHDFACAFDHVEIGHDGAFIVPHKTGAATARHLKQCEGTRIANQLLMSDKHHARSRMLKDFDGVAFIVGGELILGVDGNSASHQKHHE